MSSLEDTPPFTQHLRGRLPSGPTFVSDLLFIRDGVFGYFSPFLFSLLRLRRSRQATNRRLARRMGGTSTDSTMIPRGIIQKPTIGKNPNAPRITNKTPIINLKGRDFGNRTVRLPNFNFAKSFPLFRISANHRAPVLSYPGHKAIFCLVFNKGLC